jgi:hypothetical protein
MHTLTKRKHVFNIVEAPAERRDWRDRLVFSARILNANVKFPYPTNNAPCSICRNGSASGGEVNFLLKSGLQDGPSFDIVKRWLAFFALPQERFERQVR